MNFRDKAFETAVDFRNRAMALAAVALATARETAPLTAETRAKVRTSLATLKSAGRELGKVAGVHAARFVEQNSTLVRAAGKDVGALARATYREFAQDGAARKPRKTTAKRKPAARARRARKSA